MSESQELLPQPHQPMGYYDVDQLIQTTALQIGDAVVGVQMDASHIQGVFSKRVGSELVSADAERNVRIADAEGRRLEAIRRADEDLRAATNEAEHQHERRTEEIKEYAHSADRLFATCRRLAEEIYTTFTSRKEAQGQINTAIEEERGRYDLLLTIRVQAERALVDTESAMEIEQRTITSSNSVMQARNEEFLNTRRRFDESKAQASEDRQRVIDEIDERQGLDEEMEPREREEALAFLDGSFAYSGDMTLRKGDQELLQRLLDLNDEIDRARQDGQTSTENLRELMNTRIELMESLRQMDRDIRISYQKIGNLEDQKQEIAAELTDLLLTSQLLRLITTGNLQEVGSRVHSNLPSEVDLKTLLETSRVALPPELVEVWSQALDLYGIRQGNKHAANQSVLVRIDSIDTIVQPPNGSQTVAARQEIASRVEQVLALGGQRAAVRESTRVVGSVVRQFITSPDSPLGRAARDVGVLTDVVRVELRKAKNS